LSSRWEFSHVYSAGARVSEEGGRLLAAPPPPSFPSAASRIGLAVGRRLSRSSVRRNRAKRLLREGLAALYPCIPDGWWLVFEPRRVPPSLGDALLLLMRLLARAGLLRKVCPLA